MASQAAGDRLELEEDMAFQRRSWRAQRLGRAALYLMMLAALVGVFGGGGLSRTRAATEDGRLEVEWQRWARNHADSELVLRLAPEVAREPVRVALDRAWLEAIEVKSAAPVPEKTVLEGDRIVLEYAAVPRGEPVLIRLQLRTLRPGRVAGEIGLAGETGVRVAQFIYP